MYLLQNSSYCYVFCQPWTTTHYPGYYKLYQSNMPAKYYGNNYVDRDMAAYIKRINTFKLISLIIILLQTTKNNTLIQ